MTDPRSERPPTPGPPSPPALRVSDGDRHAVVDRLRQSCGEGRLTLDEFGDRTTAAFAARTATELEQLTADLPPPSTTALAPTGATTTRPERRWIVGVFGGADVRGRWRPARPTRVVTVFAGTSLDLSHVDAGAEIDLQVFSLFGSVEVLVPEGTAAEVHGLIVFGSRSCKVADDAVGPPVVRVTAYGAFGSVGVRTRRRVP